MSNKKPIPPYPAVLIEEEIEEDLKTMDEAEAPLLTGELLCEHSNRIYLVISKIILTFMSILFRRC